MNNINPEQRLDNIKRKETGNPWDRQGEETDTAYQRFSVYLELGSERTLEKVGKRLGKGRGYEKVLERWSAKHNWVYRTSKYDEHLLLKSLENREKLIDKAHDRMLKMLDKALDEYESILLLDNVIHVGEGNTTTINERIKVVKDILDRLGIDFSAKKGAPEERWAKIVNNFYQQIYNDLRGD